MSDLDSAPAASSTADLAQRLTAVEDELAIRNLIVRYGLAVDCGNAEVAAALHTENCEYIVADPGTGRSDADAHAGANLIMQGRAAIRDMVEGAGHQALLPNCAHTVGPLQVQLNGTSARATGYSRLYLQEGDSVRLLRLGFNRWLVQKTSSGWLILQRTSCPVGSNAAQQLLIEDSQEWAHV